MKNKYGNRKTTVYGITFDSKHEAERYLLLRSMQNKGEISHLRLQVPFELIPSYRVNGKTERAVKYIADFVYEKDGETIVEDAKGFRTDIYKLKKKMLYHTHGVVIKEV